MVEDLAAVKPWNLYEVTITWGPHTATSVLSASSRSRAIYQAFLDFSDAWPCSFRQFLDLVKARRVQTCADDGYGYVRRAYGVDPTIGATVELVNENDWTGKRGVIVHPGRSSTAHVHVAFPDINHPLSVHPNNVRILQQELAA